MIRRKFRLTLKIFFVACIMAGCFRMHLSQRHVHRHERRKERGLLTSDINSHDVTGQQINISVEGLAPPSVVKTYGRILHAENNKNVSEETKAQPNTTAQINANESVSNDSLIVVNPHPYTFVLNHPDKCAGKEVFLVMIVTSSPNNHAQRYAIRHTWGSTRIRNARDINIVTVFAVGKPDDVLTQRALEYENKVHNDIIQEDFVDSYTNLTLKTVMCLKWASEFCPNAKFVMKADDDAFVNTYSLVRHLSSLHAANRSKLLTGHIFSGALPIRDLKGKQKRWYLSKEDYPRETFPKYPCGFAYVMSSDVIRPLYEVSLTVKYLFLEDVFMGLCLEKLRIEPEHQGGFRIYKAPTTSCKSVKQLASHWFKTPEDMVNAWKVLNENC
ncbi:beta-1,3-galactosyltransferase 1-like [Branchiostoma lanceolatum]|uniref:beta-1,3-galactosyltransferase 1-like n=1 Tax=Branchiostoma lanceolatum TaxID=7740 RepID=UPI003453C27C